MGTAPARVPGEGTDYYEASSGPRIRSLLVRETLAGALFNVGADPLPAGDGPAGGGGVSPEPGDPGGSSPTSRPRTRNCFTWAAETSDCLGDLLVATGRLAEAADAFACRDAAQELPGVPSGAPRSCALLAQAHGDLGRVHDELNQFRNAEVELGQAIPILEKLVAEDSQNQDARAKLAVNLNYLGGILFGISPGSRSGSRLQACDRSPASPVAPSTRVSG